MELETQVQVSTNQLRRQDDEGKRVRESLETALTREKEMANKAREQQHRFVLRRSVTDNNNQMMFGQFRQILGPGVSHEGRTDECENQVHRTEPSGR